MERLILSLYILAAVACGPAVLTASASAEIIPECQWLTDAFPKHYVKERANVRDAPNTNGNILATIDGGSIVYTNEGTRNVEGNPEKWYQVLATKSLPAWSGCSGGYIHPSLVSQTPPSTQTQHASGSGSGRKWVGLAIGYVEPEGEAVEADMLYVIAWNQPSRQAAIDGVIRECRSKGGHKCEFGPKASDYFPCVGAGLYETRYSVASRKTGNQVNAYGTFYKSEAEARSYFYDPLARPIHGEPCT